MHRAPTEDEIEDARVEEVERRRQYAIVPEVEPCRWCGSFGCPAAASRDDEDCVRLQRDTKDMEGR